VNRRFILVALLAIFVAGCGTQQADATPTPEPTPDATPEPTEEPTPSDEDGGGTALDEVIPDEVNGVAGTSIPGMDTLLQSALQAQGLDAGEAEFAFVTYGEGDDAVILNAFRIPGVEEVAMETLARMMAGVGGESGVEAEATTIGGKSVLSFSGGATPGVVYFYVADDVAFTIAGQNADFAEDLLSELP
jgi:hypothetical protein